MIVAYILTMPNNNSWNGKWTGDGKLYVRTRSYRNEKKAPAEGDHYYNFGDGWGANVQVRHVERGEATRLKNRSKGFCGYEWMIDEIERHGRILPLSSRIKKTAEETNG
jgi:hypothetical protein